MCLCAKPGCDSQYKNIQPNAIEYNSINDVMLNVNYFIILCVLLLIVMVGIMPFGIMILTIMPLSSTISINNTRSIMLC